MLKPQNDLALKESALAIRLLAQGKSIVLVRDTDAVEEKGEGVQRHGEFFLFPVHDDMLRLGIKPGVQAEFDTAAASHQEAAGRLRFTTCVKVRAVASFSDPGALESAYDEHPYLRDWIAQRFEKAGARLYLWVVRAYVLPSALSLVDRPMYDGSRRWVRLEGPLPTKGARPVLPDDVFARRLASVRNKLSQSTIGTSSAGLARA